MPSLAEIGSPRRAHPVDPAVPPGRRRPRLALRTSRRWLLVVVLASIAINAALGIYALLVPHFGELQGRVLGTSACVTGAGAFAFACLPALERRRLRPLPLAGIAGSTLAFTLAVISIWALSENETFGKTVGTAFAVAAVGVLGSVLSLARLAPRFRWAFPAAVLLASVLASMVVALIWMGEPSSTWYPRSAGVVAVLLAAVTLALPVLHRASRGELAATTGPVVGVRVRFCPSCGRPLRTLAAGEAVCESCGARFRVRYLAAGG